MRQEIPFDKLPVDDREWLLKDTWCDACQKADLGVAEPRLYRDNEREFFVGRCLACGSEITTEIVIREIQGEAPKW